MTNTSKVITYALAIASIAVGLSAATSGRAPVKSSDPQSWDAKAAAAYLDARAAWWMDWPNAKRDHGTFCVSCHTAAPYAIARPALRTLLREQSPTPTESRLTENVAKRVKNWNEMAPFYPDQLRGIPKTSESRGTEAILNAVVLAARDREAGHLADDTRTAFANLWALQMRTPDLSGSWAWLNFHYEPWESAGSPYFGASLAAVAAGAAPDGYAASADAQEPLKLLRAYLQREHEHQPLFNRLMGLWADAELHDVLTPEERQQTIDAAFAAQRDDGGWTLAALGSWKRLDGSTLDTNSDGYATGLAVLALERAQAGGSAADVGGSKKTRPADLAVGRGLEWLRTHQDRETGRWITASLNKDRDPKSDIGRFMSDAATAYAVMALARAR